MSDKQQWGIWRDGKEWVGDDGFGFSPLLYSSKENAEFYASLLRRHSFNTCEVRPFPQPATEPNEPAAEDAVSQYVRSKEKLQQRRKKLATELDRIDKALGGTSEPVAAEQKPEKPRLEWLRWNDLSERYEAVDVDGNWVSVRVYKHGVFIAAPERAGLTRDMARELAEVLAYYAKTGELP